MRIIHISELTQASIRIDMRYASHQGTNITKSISTHHPTILVILFPVIIFIYDFKVRTKACVIYPRFTVKNSGFRFPTVINCFSLQLIWHPYQRYLWRKYMLMICIMLGVIYVFVKSQNCVLF